jgi:hypothetical protein
MIHAYRKTQTKQMTLAMGAVNGTRVAHRIGAGIAADNCNDSALAIGRYFPAEGAREGDV